VEYFGFDALAGALGTKPWLDMACPECGPRCTTAANRKKAVLRVWRKADDFLTYSCVRCSFKGHAASGLCRRKPIPRDLPRRNPPIVVPGADQARRIERGLSIWHDARDIRGTPSGAYLNGRGLDVSEDLSHALRHSSDLYYEGRTVSGMVALMRDVVTWVPCGLHRTFVSPKGVKLGRKMLGRAKGAAIMIDDQPSVVSGLHIGEGIESVLAARQLGYRPAWAVGSAGAIADFPVLAGIEALSVFTENDRASTEAARTVCSRYQAAGYEVWIAQPPTGDFNDTISEAA
jgi:hypothetical protein